MTTAASPDLAVSTWSLHRALGVSYPNAPGAEGIDRAERTWGPGTTSLMAVPEQLAKLGIHRIEICSFHLPATDNGFHAELRAAMTDAGVTFQTLLIDDGDITDPDQAERDVDWIGGWIDVAAALGAEKARIIAGKQPPSPEALERSIAGLRRLARRGSDLGVRVITENWHATMAGPEEVMTVIDALDGSVGLLADFGNWSGPSKYDDLATILPHAENTHAKCAFSESLAMDADDFGRCLAEARKAGYDGPYTLIYESANDDEWRAVQLERDFVIDQLRQPLH
ncbi:MAG: sugar phosphate isomerase/epimerase [Hyphomicrobiales bacterium]|nr:sugar phosphate isomerase/epimerase [Hyphomicrobiales bacterium]